MPVYDLECQECGVIKEHILSVSQMEKGGFECGECQGVMKVIISASGQYCGNDDAGWLKSVTDVVDPTTGPAAAEFYKNPTRAGYKKWMKESGIRPREHGEKTYPDKPDMTKAHDEVMRKHHDRLSNEQYRRKSERILRRGHEIRE
jgi:predicted nucleic acid-binding Zn ribbon protein